MLVPLILADGFDTPIAAPTTPHPAPVARRAIILSSISDDHVIVIGSIGASKRMVSREPVYAEKIRLKQAEKTATAIITRTVRGYAHG